jgi:DNA-binding NarL/FixJ family response regulator
MPRLSGLEVLRELRTGVRPVHTIILTAAIEKAEIVTALQLGASGIVLKDAATEVLFKSIASVMNGQHWVGREATADLVQALRDQMDNGVPAMQKRAPRFGLTPRELQVVSTVVAGYSNREIAKKFSLSEDTVKHHLSKIFDKTGASNRLELALFAVHHRILDADERIPA